VIQFAARYPTRFLRSYARVKTATDPAYEAVFDVLRDSQEPLFDVGCGIGALAFYLRERGFRGPIVGIDHDRRKIEVARNAAGTEENLSFGVADARTATVPRGNVVLLDLLHYFTDEEQSIILQTAAATAQMVIIRDGIRDGTLRYHLTYAQEALSRAGGWLKADRLNFPTRQAIEQPFAGTFRAEVRRMFGRTPFNNYLFVFRRSSAGMTNE
jgi:SAM-dependent methyltransferase